MHILAFGDDNGAFQRHRILSQRMSKSFPDTYQSFKYLRNKYLQVTVFIGGVKDGLPCTHQL